MAEIHSGFSTKECPICSKKLKPPKNGDFKNRYKRETYLKNSNILFDAASSGSRVRISRMYGGKLEILDCHVQASDILSCLYRIEYQGCNSKLYEYLTACDLCNVHICGLVQSL